MSKSESTPQEMKRKRSMERVDDRKRIKLDISQTSITSFFKPRAATSSTISELSPAQTTFKIQTDSPYCKSRAKDAMIIVSDDEDDIAQAISSSSVQDCKSKTPEKSSSVAERQTSISEKRSSVKERLSASFVCCYCKIGFSNLLSWKQHENSHRPGFRCGICDQVFATEKLLKKHDACKNSTPNELEEGTFDCPLCEYSAKSGKGLRVHSKRKHGINSESETPDQSKSEECGYYCKKCKYFTLSKVALKIHAVDVHQDSNQDFIHQCSLCGAIFITSKALTIHTHSIHHKKKGNCDCVKKCDLCKFVATTLKGLMNHMRTHVNSSSQAAEGYNSRNAEAIDMEDDLKATGNGSEADESVLEDEGESKPKGNHIRNITSDWD
ncbi:zinc finger Y-chromosomal protein isoform X2 [Eurytemora carolleeae]|uniref:zinc finger Y-chromosomal protein isoform X2 n=1 Tax=Eurytemora carolleeae TaxID=1294199 RepID=UPI000C77A05B|nr:zinc finger Y-chromosomal protein isoform X2 [Eurytemora carolleeae]|eukprot:XP_023329429.1 zinc finger Y-chromosomal protein-like isoform X2 [Eurytemora affinis]